MRLLLLLGPWRDPGGFLLVEAHWTKRAKLLLETDPVYASNRKAAPIARQSRAHTG